MAGVPKRAFGEPGGVRLPQAPPVVMPVEPGTATIGP